MLRIEMGYLNFYENTTWSFYLNERRFTHKIGEGKRFFSEKFNLENISVKNTMFTEHIRAFVFSFKFLLCFCAQI